jgi:hypothetical protein
VTEPPAGKQPGTSPSLRIEIQPPEGTHPGSIPPLYIEMESAGSTIVHNYGSSTTSLTSARSGHILGDG